MRTAIVVVVLVSAVLSAGMAQDEYPVYVYPCPKVDAGPGMDGELEEAAWAGAPVVSGFTFYNDPERLAPVQTSVRVVYDARRVYFGVVCDEPLAGKMAPVRTARDDGHVFRQEAVEVFIDPAHDHARYCQFAVGGAGGLFDGLINNVSWNSEAEVATRIGEGEWTLELAIPWSDLGVEPEPGTVIGFNVCRDRELAGIRQWTNWSQTKANFHDPARFAHLVLSPPSDQLGGLGEEFRKGDRTGPLRIFGPGGFSETSYRQLAREALRALDAQLAEIEAVRRQEADGTTARELAERIDERKAEVAKHRAAIEGDEALDGARWVQMELEMRRIAQELDSVVWEARLAALLAGI